MNLREYAEKYIRNRNDRANVKRLAVRVGKLHADAIVRTLEKLQEKIENARKHRHSGENGVS